MDDPYFKLRPEPPTPVEGLCDCQRVAEIYLAHKLRSNPVYCLSCNGQIPPDKLGCGEQLAEDIASWNSVYGALYHLWLDSGEYETWARERLLDPKGQVNLRGMELVGLLDSIAKTYYLWFYESDESAPTTCPLCGAALTAREGCRFAMCENCRVIV